MLESKSSQPLILLVFANDHDQPLAEIQQEMHSLQTILNPVAERLQYDIQVLEFSSVDNLIQHLDDNRERLILLHFAGHSNSEVLKLDEGEAHASGLVDKLRACKHLQLLFLNGCNNARQVQQFVLVGIPATIGTSTPIADTLALEFSTHFYTELAERRISVQVAFEQARATITTKRGDQFRTLNVRSLDESVTAASQPQWSWFLEQTNQHDWKLEEAAHPCNRLPVLPVKTAAQLPGQPFKNLYYYRPEDAEIFFGRCQPTLDVLTRLDDGKFPLLLLHGGTGVGKSSFLMAGLIPRLQARGQAVGRDAQEVFRYDERITPFNLLPEVFNSHTLADIRTQLEAGAANGQPHIWILDQLEEIFFRTETPKTQQTSEPTDPPDTSADQPVISKEEQQDNLPDTLNLLLKTLQALFPHDQPDSWPSARIILSLRTEWFGELHDACRQYQLASQDYLLKPLGRTDIIEIIEQPTQKPLLVEKYGLKLQQPAADAQEEPLAEKIADALLNDKESNIAPPLQILLSKLWQQVEQLPPEERIWTDELYREQSAQGLMLSEHLKQQLVEIGEQHDTTYGAWGKRARDSGLLLDVLHAHTTPQGMAKTLSVTEYKTRYAHIPFRDVLARTFTDRYLLIDPLNNKNQLRLAHDTLAGVVKAEYDTSDLPGQRAQRILDSRKADWTIVEGKPKGTALDTYDLKLVEQGQEGTRDWQKDPIETAIVHKSRKQRRNGRIIVGSVIMTLILAFVATVFLYLRAEEQRLEGNYKLAKVFEEKAQSSLSKGKQSNNIDELRKAWLYALEAEKLELPAKREGLMPISIGELTVINENALTPERLELPSPYFQDFVQVATFSPDGKVLVTGSYEGRLRLWDIKTGTMLRILDGHTASVSTLAYSPDGKVIASGSFDQTVRLWDASSGKPLQTLAGGHTRPITMLGYSPDSKILVSGSDDHVHLWDAGSGKALRTLQSHTADISALAYSPNGKVIATGSSDHMVRLWDAFSAKTLKTLQGHEGSVDALSYSPDGKVIATGSSDHTVRLWDVSSGKLLKILQGHTGSVYAVIYSPDGKVLASASRDNAIRLWDTDMGTELKTLRGRESPFDMLAFSSDGKVITTGGGNSVWWQWDTNSGQVLKTLNRDAVSMSALAYSPNGKVIATSSSDNTVLWDVKTGAKLNILSGGGKLAYSPDGKVIAIGSDDNTVLWDVRTGAKLDILSGGRKLAYSPDGKVIATGSTDNTVLWDVQTGAKLNILSGGGTELAYSPDGKVIATGSTDDTVQLWDVVSGKHLKTLQEAGWPVAYSPNGKVIVSDGRDNSVRLWDASNGVSLKTLKGHTGIIYAVTYSPDGKVIATGSSDHTVRLWDASSGKHLRTLQGHREIVRSVVYSPDGKVIATGSTDNTVLWNAQTGAKLDVLSGGGELAYSPDGKVLVLAGSTVWLRDVNASEALKVLEGHGLAYSPDGKAMATISKDNAVKLWNVHTGVLTKTLEGNSGFNDPLVYSPDGKVIAADGGNNTIRLWDTVSGQELRTLRSQNAVYDEGGDSVEIYALAYSPDGRVLASAGSEDNTVRLWDTHSGNELKPLNYQGRELYELVYSPDGKMIAAGGKDGTIHLWDTITGNALKSIRAHNDYIFALAYSPNGKVLASGGGDNTVRLWDSKTGVAIKTLEGHSGYIDSLAYSPDGKVLVSGSRDNTVRLWDVHTGQMLKTLSGHGDYVSSLVYSPDGNVIASTGGDNTVRLWDMDSPAFRLFYDFDPKDVSDALKFLWKIELDGLEFKYKPREPRLFPLKEYYFTYDTKYRPLLDLPRANETKIDQLVRFLEAECAYKDPDKMKGCEAKGP